MVGGACRKDINAAGRLFGAMPRPHNWRRSRQACL